MSFSGFKARQIFTQIKNVEVLKLKDNCSTT